MSTSFEGMFYSSLHGLKGSSSEALRRIDLSSYDTWALRTMHANCTARTSRYIQDAFVAILIDHSFQARTSIGIQVVG